MKEYQKEYEEYMKSITDGFAKLCSFEGAESILAGEGNRVSVMIYQYQEFLLEYDKNLKHMYRLESFNKRVKEFHKKRQEVAEKFLNENSVIYDEWFVNTKQKTEKNKLEPQKQQLDIPVVIHSCDDLKKRTDECSACDTMANYEDPDKWDGVKKCPKCGKDTEILKKSWD